MAQQEKGNKRWDVAVAEVEDTIVTDGSRWQEASDEEVLSEARIVSQAAQLSTPHVLVQDRSRRAVAHANIDGSCYAICYFKSTRKCLLYDY